MVHSAQINFNEKPFFFENDGYKLFGVMHSPVSNDLKEGVVFCHPFAEEKLWSQRVFVDYARQLAEKGYTVLRFDLMGHGDSDGHFEESNIETHLSDIHCAIKTLKRDCPTIEKVSLLGLRLGASLAAIAAEANPEISKLVLWDPLIDGNKFMQMTLRSNLTMQMATHKKIIMNRDQMVEKMKEGGSINLEGYQLSYSYFSQLSLINLNKEGKQFSGSVLIVQIGKEGQPIHKELERLGSLYNNAVIEHVVEEPFWKEIRYFCEKAKNLSSVTNEWLENKNA